MSIETSGDSQFSSAVPFNVAQGIGVGKQTEILWMFSSNSILLDEYRIRLRNQSSDGFC